MRFDDLDTMMRVFETNHDHCVLPGLYMAARLDGRSFTSLTRNKHSFEAPFDQRFRDLMLETTRHLMGCGFRAIYGYTQSDEISILFHPEEDSFSRKERKFISILSGEASAKFSLALGGLAAFDARLSLLPSVNRVVDYFRWRMEDAARNCLNAHCYWTLCKQGQNAENAALTSKGLSSPQKHDLLFAAGTNFNDLPAWQKRGCGLYWQHIEKNGFDPHANLVTKTLRRQLKTDFDLPLNESYGDFIRAFLESRLEDPQ